MNDNILQRPYISFHGLGDFDISKLKRILIMGILPNSMLPDIKPRNELLGNNDTKVYLVKSPSLVGTKLARGYRAYIENCLGLVVDLFPLDPNESIKRSFPDAGYLNGAIAVKNIIGIIYPANLGTKTIRELIKKEELSFDVDEEMLDLSLEDAIKFLNVNGLPIYDSISGQKITDLEIEQSSRINR